MREVLICGYVRSPFTPAGSGRLKDIRPEDLVAQVIAGLLRQVAVQPAEIEDLLMGCAFPEAEQGMNIARLSALRARLPRSVAGATINRFCGSSMYAVHMAAGAIRMNAGDAFICGGVESLSRIPLMGFNPMPHPELYKADPAAYISVGEAAENIAVKYQINRGQQDAYALRSQTRAVAADESGKTAAEIIPIRDDRDVVRRDSCLKQDCSLDSLAEEDPAFSRSGTITSGNSAPYSDGATALFVCSREFADRYNLTVFAKIRSIAVAGCEPELLGTGPVPATIKALDRAGLTIGDIDVAEVSEGCAAETLACIQDLGLNGDIVNLDGGAIALGNPIGATGARLTGKAASLLNGHGAQFALATQAVTGGQGIATILEAA